MSEEFEKSRAEFIDRFCELRRTGTLPQIIELLRDLTVSYERILENLLLRPELENNSKIKAIDQCTVILADYNMLIREYEHQEKIADYLKKK